MVGAAAGWAVQGDEALLAALGRGDGDALTALCERYGGFVRQVAGRVLGDPEAAEDVAQEVFLKVWQTARFDPARGTPRRWLFAIAHHHAVDYLRVVSARARRYPSLDALGDSLICPDGWEALDDALRQEALHAGLATLPAEQRRAIEVVYLDGQTQCDLAARDGIPLGTIKARTRRGLMRLRRLLGEPSDNVDSDARERDCASATDARPARAIRGPVATTPPMVPATPVGDRASDLGRAHTAPPERFDELTSDEREELRRLRHELRTLRQEREMFRTTAVLLLAQANHPVPMHQ